MTPAALAKNVFSTPALRRVMVTGASEQLDAALMHFSGDGAVPRFELFEAAFAWLSRDYPNEYFVRDLLISNYFVARRVHKTSVILNEFAVGESFADCVLINGVGTVYEIKTVLDSPTRLAQQLQDYYQAFSRVELVVDEREIERYSRFRHRYPIGLLAVRPRRRLRRVVEAGSYEAELNSSAILQTLRQAEGEAALTSILGPLPPVPSGVRYTRNLALARGVEPAELQRAAYREMKANRRLNCTMLLADPRFKPLRAMLVQLNPTAQQSERIKRWLEACV